MEQLPRSLPILMYGVVQSRAELMYGERVGKVVKSENVDRRAIRGIEEAKEA